MQIGQVLTLIRAALWSKCCYYFYDVKAGKCTK